MKLLFSEAKADYGHYIFPYAVWAFPEPGETPADLLNHGFLPSSRNLDRFYLCRHVRVNLGGFKPSSENRRILRKGEGIAVTLVPRAEFDYDPARRQFFKNYADIKFGKDVMTYERLDSLFGSKITSHVLVFTDSGTGAEVGVVTLYLEPSALAFYYYAFYDLNYYTRNLGMFMMTWAVEFFQARGFDHLYLGSCYAPKALYNALAAKFTISSATQRAAPRTSSTHIKKLLMPSYTSAFQFEQPRTPNAVTDDSYRCALTDSRPPAKKPVHSTDEARPAVEAMLTVPAPDMLVSHRLSHATQIPTHAR